MREPAAEMPNGFLGHLTNVRQFSQSEKSCCLGSNQSNLPKKQLLELLDAVHSRIQLVKVGR